MQNNNNPKCFRPGHNRCLMAGVLFLLTLLKSKPRARVGVLELGLRFLYFRSCGYYRMGIMKDVRLVQCDFTHAIIII